MSSQHLDSRFGEIPNRTFSTDVFMNCDPLLDEKEVSTMSSTRTGNPLT